MPRHEGQDDARAVCSLAPTVLYSETLLPRGRGTQQGGRRHIACLAGVSAADGSQREGNEEVEENKAQRAAGAQQELAEQNKQQQQQVSTSDAPAECDAQPGSPLLKAGRREEHTATAGGSSSSTSSSSSGSALSLSGYGMLRAAGIIGLATATSKVLVPTTPSLLTSAVCIHPGIVAAVAAVGWAPAAMATLSHGLAGREGQGLVRETAVAAAFGVGPAVTAFSYASIIPAFCLSLLGGINGPFHSAMTAALSKMEEVETRQQLVRHVSLLTGTTFAVAAIAIAVCAAPLIDVLAPGLRTAGAQGLLTRSIAIRQLRVMAPCAPMAALIGIGFGRLRHATHPLPPSSSTCWSVSPEGKADTQRGWRLGAVGRGGDGSAAEKYAVPSLSPCVSSLAVLAAVALHSVRTKGNSLTVPHHMAGTHAPLPSACGTALAAGVTVGAVAQWLLQQEAWAPPPTSSSPSDSHTTTTTSSSSSSSSMHTAGPLSDPGVHEVLRVVVPATLASGLLQIATFTDLYFASFLPGAAAALGYANLLVMAPLGILSSALLIPLLPLFSRLSQPERWEELKGVIRRSLVISAAVTVPMTAIMVPLARALVRVVFQRRAFDASACHLVASLLTCYVAGVTVYLVRDVAVRVFYALGDGTTPFRVSALAIAGNALLDWLLVARLGWGAQGLIAATVAVNAASALALLLILRTRLNGLGLKGLQRTCASITGASLCAYGAARTGRHLADLVLLWPAVARLAPRMLWILDACLLGVVAGLGLIVYLSVLLSLGVPEGKSVWDSIMQRLQLRTQEASVC
eukprot:jgi/Mesen1/1207/ME000128S00184